MCNDGVTFYVVAISGLDFMLRPSGRDSTGRTLTELGIEDLAMVFILIAPFYILHERYFIYNKIINIQYPDRQFMLAFILYYSYTEDITQFVSLIIQKISLFGFNIKQSKYNTGRINI